MSEETSYPPGSVRVRAKPGGRDPIVSAHDLQVEVMGNDGQWALMSFVRSLNFQVTGGEEVTLGLEVWPQSLELPVSVTRVLLGEKPSTQVAMRTLLDQLNWRPTHVHLKTGGLYRVIRRGFRESNLEPVVVYEGAGPEYKVWVRPATEFDDGRFESLD